MNTTPETLVVEQLSPWLDHKPACRMAVRIGGKACKCGLTAMLATLSSKGRGEAPEPCSPVAREGVGCACGEIAGENLGCPLHGEGTLWAKENPDVCEIAERMAALSQTAPALSGGGELREALDPDDVRGILLRSAEQADVAARLHRGAVADGLTDDTSVAEWCEKQARAFRLAALAQSTPAVGEGL